MLTVVERFVSINGEGAHAGELAAFIRFKGCNLGCSYCDTKWANSQGAVGIEYTADSLVDWVERKRVKNVTLTGGEPLLQDDIDVLIIKLLSMGLRVEIETNGSLPLNRFIGVGARPAFTMDYKLPSSNMESAMRRDNFMLLGEHDTVKFVAGSIDDLERAREIIEDHKLCGRCHVYLSPVFGKIRPSEMVDYMIEHEMNGVRLQLQLHKFIWSPEKRGV